MAEEEAVTAERVIRVMPETLANKIAAGEVVQRPAAAVKELLENAIDAGADEIEVTILDAGRSLIHVTDNGCGMSSADAQHCFSRHATSKIRTVRDLEHIETLGFRGEALASIAAVSQVTMRTRRRADEAGFLVRIHGGEVKAAEPCASRPGTSIEVRNLFYNVPARRNFLKTPATEFRHVSDVFQSLALGNPRIAFLLRQADTEIHRLPRPRSSDFEESLQERMHALFGSKVTDNVVPVCQQTSYISVAGFLGKPRLGRKSRSEQFLFVNGRSVRSRALSHAVASAYEGLLKDRVYPFFVLYLSIDPGHVDVNVHPTKTEVKFDDERGVYGFLKTVARKALATSNLVPRMDDAGFRIAIPVKDRPPVRRGPADGGFARDAEAPSKLTIVPRTTQMQRLSDLLYSPISDSEAETPAGEGEEVEQPAVETLLWQLHNRYILAQLRTGLLIVDQRAAQERILYERALESMNNGLGLSQQLLFPRTIEFGPADLALVKELKPELVALGFSLEAFGGRTVVVRGVPADVRVGSEEEILEDLLHQYKENEAVLRITGRDNVAKSMARHASVRAGEALSSEEMRTLIDRLFLCKRPYVSPYGRPTMVQIPMEELDRRFARRPS